MKQKQEERQEEVKERKRKNLTKWKPDDGITFEIENFFILRLDVKKRRPQDDARSLVQVSNQTLFDTFVYKCKL